MISFSCHNILYKNNKNESTSYGQAETSIISETNDSSWTRLIFYQRPISAEGLRCCLLKTFTAGESWCQRLSSSVVFIGQRFLFDRSSSWVKTWKSGCTMLRLAFLFKLKPRNPEGLNFCHCSHVLLWGTHTHTLRTHNPCKYNVFFSKELKLIQLFHSCASQEVAVPCMYKRTCCLSLGSNRHSCTCLAEWNWE